MSNLESKLKSHRITSEGLKGWAFADVVNDEVVTDGLSSSSEAFSKMYDYVKDKGILTNMAILADYGDHYVVESTF